MSRIRSTLTDGESQFRPAQPKKRAVESKVYLAKRKLFLEANPVCEFPGCFDRSLDVHHMRGRGRYYLEETTWMAVDRKHHRWLHEHPNEARKMGLLWRDFAAC